MQSGKYDSGRNAFATGLDWRAADVRAPAGALAVAFARTDLQPAVVNVPPTGVTFGHAAQTRPPRDLRLRDRALDDGIDTASGGLRVAVMAQALADEPHAVEGFAPRGALRVVAAPDAVAFVIPAQAGIQQTLVDQPLVIADIAPAGTLTRKPSLAQAQAQIWLLAA